MTRFAVCFSVFLISSFAIAQVPDSGTATPAPATAPVKAAVTSAASPEIQQFQKLLDSWDDAVNRRDQYALELVLSPLFVDVSASGDITTRNQQLATLIANEDKTLHLSQRVITIRLLGDTAVANGTYVLHHKAVTGQTDEKGVFTQVFERARGGWVCLNSQRTWLREDSNTKSKKQSSAEMPFHIPLFSKSDKQ
jgi:ketosteroid isomerase-like protein